MTQTFTILDPRTFDGDPYEVADRAFRQAAALARLLRQSVEGARLMARNAELERQLYFDGACDAAVWEDGPQARKLDAILDEIAVAERQLNLLATAAGFDPRAPLGR